MTFRRPFRISPSVHFNIMFYVYTVPILPIVAVLLILGVANPFWFRREFLEWIGRQAEKYADWRNQRLQPLAHKRDLFLMLKDDYAKN